VRRKREHPQRGQAVPSTIAQARVFEFVANNPGDWLMHCHMVHHMMNHMVKQVGPRVRSYQLYELVMHSDEDVAPGAVFDEIVRRSR
jgi:hypothetical protein